MNILDEYIVLSL